MNLDTYMRTILLNKVISNNNPTLYSLATIAAYDFASKNAPEVGNIITKYIKKKFEQNDTYKNLASAASDITGGKQISKIKIDRNFDKNNITNNNWGDAIINHILSLDGVKSLYYNGDVLIPDDNDCFEVYPDITFRLLNLKFKDTELDGISFQLESERGMSYIHEYIRDCRRNYDVQLQEEMGDSLYFFDQYIVQNRRLSYANSTPESNLIFEKNKFLTNRCLSNVFFENKEYLETRVNLFKNNKPWYDERGIPYTLGLMLHGAPGCGKTSTIKAIAKELNRHIVNIQLSHIQTNTQLKKLFYDDKIHIMERENDVNIKHKTLNIPIEKRLYVIEDIDAMGDLVHKRTPEKDEVNTNTFGSAGGMTNLDEVYGNAIGMINSNISNNNENTKYFKDDDAPTNKPPPDPITLSSLLNILDGTLEIPGRVLIITTNHPEKIDPALIRPGRIDMILEYKKANHDIIQQMYNSFFREVIPDNELRKIKSYHFSPAEVNAILFRNFFDPNKALQELQS